MIVSELLDDIGMVGSYFSKGVTCSEQCFRCFLLVISVVIPTCRVTILSGMMIKLVLSSGRRLLWLLEGSFLSYVR